MITLLHNNSCSKSRCVFDYLEAEKIPYELVDFVNHPVSEQFLKSVLQKLNLPVEAIIRKNEMLFQEQFAQKDISEEEWLKILIENPELMQRPILIKDEVAIIGRPFEKVVEFLKK
ncbi:arsenate reductase family protein [Chryseobacterium koreense]|uniref:arsenate reductase family protein n=1 Tax=Chryseobacterium koreense TaxID=232216 RepID=UPI0026F1EE3E|nr:ArsC/Spx/MgsR family protein [Chryseobacterium koreense]